MNMINGIKVKRIEPLAGNTFTPDWSNTTKCAMTTMDKAPSRPSTVAEFDVPLNYKEMQLALDNTDTMNESWNLLNAAVLERTGMQIIGVFELLSITINGQTRPLH
jgi:hypothetical protein